MDLGNNQLAKFINLQRLLKQPILRPDSLMKLFFYSIAIIYVLFSCNHEEKLSGNWMGAYVLHYSSGKKPTYTKIDVMMSFEGDSIRSKTFDLWNELEWNAKYRIVDNKLFVYRPDLKIDTISLASVTDDSIVLEIFSEYRREVILKRFSESSSPNKIALTGKAFWLKGGDYSDSIEFVSDTILVHLGTNRYQIERWGINNYKNFRFLLLGQLSLPFFIKADSNGTIQLKKYSTSVKAITLEPIKENPPLESLNGSWEEVSRSGDPNSYFNHHKMKLEFESDSVKITEGRRIRKFQFGANVTKQFFYFPEMVSHRDEEGIWVIIESKNDKLIIDRKRDPVFPEILERIEFKRFR